MSLAAIVRALVDAGATPQMILAAVEAGEAAQAGALAARRAQDAERQRRRRARHVTSRDVTATQRDALPSQESPPRPPKETQPSHTPSPPKGGSVPIRQADFDRFWAAYPRKVGRGAARKAFARAVRLIGEPEPLAAMLAALQRVRPSWRDPEFIPHPATWLNEERWSDGDAVAAAAPAPPWPGPAAFRIAALQAMGEDYVRSWLDPCGWRNGPDRHVLARTGLAADRLRRDLPGLLASHQMTVRHERPQGALRQ